MYACIRIIFTGFVCISVKIPSGDNWFTYDDDAITFTLMEDTYELLIINHDWPGATCGAT